MTAERIRRGVGQLTWSDDLAWMETMKGKGWRSFLEAERKHWLDVVKHRKVQEKADLFTQRLIAQMSAGSVELFTPPHREIWIGFHGTSAWSWKWNTLIHSAHLPAVSRTNQPTFVADLDSRSGGHIWTVQDIGEGAETYSIQYESRKKGIVWSQRGVGPYCAVVGQRVFCLEARHSLVYWRLVSWNAYTGRDRIVHYEEKNSSINLSLWRATPTTAFLLREGGGFQQLMRVTNIYTVQNLSSADNRVCRFIFGDSGYSWFQWESAEGWMPRGEFKKYRLPPLNQWNPESFSLARELLICQSFGERCIWKLSKTQQPICVWRGLGDIQLDPWGGPMARALLPGTSGAQWWDIEKFSHTPFTPKPPPLCLITAKRYTTRSADGTNIPYILVRGSNVGNTGRAARGLMIVGYSAYGISTPMSTGRWAPLLDLGWTICIGMFRGSGDSSPAWAEEGRRTGRIRVLEDAVAVIRAAKERTGCPTERIMLYGRSAGGLWVGGCAALHPRGTLFGGIYMEVPYLDVLRTTSNPALPLTEIETKEFGRADLSIVDFESQLQWSPMDLLEETGTPKLFQIVRTGVHDQEVLAYEPAKWILRSRGPIARSSSTAYFVMEEHQGHFSPGLRGIGQIALDLAVLDTWIEEAL